MNKPKNILNKFIGEEFRVSYTRYFSKLKDLRKTEDMIIAYLEDGTTVNYLLLKDKDNVNLSDRIRNGS